MNCLEGGFSSFVDYQTSLRSHYRYKINRSRKKLEKSGFRVQHIQEVEAIHDVYTPALHAMYQRVVDRSENKLEVLPRRFFHELASQLAGQIVLTVIRRDDDVAAFAWGLTSSDSYQNLFIGFDEHLNSEFDLYFNLMLCDLAFGLDQNVSVIQVGQTADEFKSRLGCVGRRRYFCVKLKSRLLDRGMRAFASRLFPPHEPPPPRRIFKEERSSAQVGQQQAVRTSEAGG